MTVLVRFFLQTYIHLIAITLSCKNEKKGKENTQIGINSVR